MVIVVKNPINPVWWADIFKIENKISQSSNFEARLINNK